MTHSRWLIILVASVALAVAATHYFTERYVIERNIAQMSEMSIFQTGVYVSLVKALDAGNYAEVRTKLKKLFDSEVSQIRSAKQLLDAGYFTGANQADIERINRYLAVPADAGGKGK